MRTKFDHSKFGKLVAELKAAKICEEVASVLESSNFPQDSLLSDVVFSSGDINAKIYFFHAEDIRQILQTLNPLEIVEFNGKTIPKMVASKMGIQYNQAKNNVTRIDENTLECYTMIADSDKVNPKYFVRCTMVLVR